MRKSVIVALMAAMALGAVANIGLGRTGSSGSAGAQRTGAERELQRLRERSLSGASHRLSKSAARQEKAQLASLTGPFVASLGDLKVDINNSISLTFRFRPGRIEVARGTRVTWVEAARLKEPHTITVARKAALPKTADEVFSCGGPGTACEPAGGHFTQPRTLRLEDDDDGEFGLDEVGDSLFERINRGISARITAPRGSTLHYICAIHPWMQGHIDVT
jgi:plastocyanin